MNDLIEETEHIIRMSGFFGKRWALLAGRDVTGLILLIEELTPPDGRVILPATCCMTRLAAVLQTGRTPVIVDVDRNLSMDPIQLVNIAKKGDLVVAVHLFGIPFRYESIYEVCKQRQCILVEDASQATGADIDGRPAGSLGIASIISFSDRKLFPTIGGGCILMEDEDLYSLMKPRVRELPSRPSFYRTTKRQMQKDFEDPLRRTRMGEIYAAGEWMALYKKYDGIYRFGVLEREVEQIQTAFAKFEDTVDHRRKMVYALRKNIERADVHILEYPINSAPWRFTFYTSNNMTGEDTMNLAEALRKGGLDVNQLYIPLHWLAPVKTVTDGCPVAEYAGVRTINIRVDQDTTEDHARIAGEIIMSLAK